MTSYPSANYPEGAAPFFRGPSGMKHSEGHVGPCRETVREARGMHLGMRMVLGNALKIGGQETAPVTGPGCSGHMVLVWGACSCFRMHARRAWQSSSPGSCLHLLQTLETMIHLKCIRPLITGNLRTEWPGTVPSHWPFTEHRGRYPPANATVLPTFLLLSSGH